MIVSPRPGEPGKMPFWKADAAGRPLELGRHIGELVREPAADAAGRRRSSASRSITISMRRPPRISCATSPIRRPRPARSPTTARSSSSACRDELGDWRMCVLSPFGGRIHAPWAMAVVERARAETGLDVETMWTDDGFVVRFPETEAPPDPGAADSRRRTKPKRWSSGSSAAPRCSRRSSARPRHARCCCPVAGPAGARPLWQQRKRAADLLAVAARYGSFPMILEAYRECLRDVFDMPALVDTLRRIESPRDPDRHGGLDDAVAVRVGAALRLRRQLHLRRRRAAGGTPGAGAGDRSGAAARAARRGRAAGAARRRRDGRRRAPAAATRRALSRALDRRRPRSAAAPRRSDAPRKSPRARRSTRDEAARALLSRRAASSPSRSAASTRCIPVEYARRYRDALGVPLPPGLPESLLEPARDAALDLARRYARTHGPFTTAEFAARYGARPIDRRGAAEDARRGGPPARGRVPARRHAAASGATREVLQTIRRRSLAKLRKEVEPVEPAVLGAAGDVAGRASSRKRAGLDALLDAIENLQGAPLPASILEIEILSARIDGYSAGGSRRAAGGRRGRLARRRAARRSRRPRRALSHRSSAAAVAAAPAGDLSPREAAILDAPPEARRLVLRALHEAARRRLSRARRSTRCGIWSGRADHQRHVPCAARVHPPARTPRRAKPAQAAGAFRSRRVAPPSAEGRWSLLADRVPAVATDTQWSTAMAQQLLARYGVVTREVAAAEGIAGGFGAVYDVLKALEDAGRVRRGYFVGGVGATQFALPPALELLRSLRDAPEEPEVAGPRRHRSRQPVRDDAEVAGPHRPLTKTAGRGPTRTRRRAGRARQRRARRLHAARRTQCSSFCRRTSRRVRRSRARWPSSWRRWRATTPRGGLLLAEINGAPAGESSAGAVPDRGGLQPVGHGFADATAALAGAPRRSSGAIAPAPDPAAPTGRSRLRGEAEHA